MKKVMIAITSALLILLLVFGGTALAGKPDNPPAEDWGLISDILEAVDACCASISGNISEVIGMLGIINGGVNNLETDVADIGSNVTSILDNINNVPQTYTHSGMVSVNSSDGFLSDPNSFYWNFPHPGRRHVILSVRPVSIPTGNDIIGVFASLDDYEVTAPQYPVKIFHWDTMDDNVYTVEFVAYGWTITAQDYNGDNLPVTAYYSAIETVVFDE
jgi:hypothetical protein